MLTTAMLCCHQRGLQGPQLKRCRHPWHHARMPGMLAQGQRRLSALLPADVLTWPNLGCAAATCADQDLWVPPSVPAPSIHPALVVCALHATLSLRRQHMHPPRPQCPPLAAQVCGALLCALPHSLFVLLPAEVPPYPPCPAAVPPATPCSKQRAGRTSCLKHTQTNSKTPRQQKQQHKQDQTTAVCMYACDKKEFGLSIACAHCCMNAL